VFWFARGVLPSVFLLARGILVLPSVFLLARGILDTKTQNIFRFYEH